MRRLARDHLWYGLHIGWDIWNTIWELPSYRDLLLGLTREFMLIRYDARGNGLSDWDVGELSLDAWVSDLETVIDAQDSPGSRFLRCRKGARLPLRLRCGSRSASRILSFMAVLQLAE